MTYAQVSTLRRRREREGFVPNVQRLGTHDKRTVVEILQYHQIELRDDPERLSTEFIVGLSNCTSRENKGIIEGIIKDDHRQRRI